MSLTLDNSEEKMCLVERTHIYNALGIPVAAGMLYPFFGLLLSPMIAAVAMILSSISVIINALRLRSARLIGK